MKKELKIFAASLLLFSNFYLINALYEDQIKKFDWHNVQIGALKNAYLELNSFQPRLLVSTQDDVIAGLCPKTGELLWRVVLESKPKGDIKLMHVNSVSRGESNTAAARPNSNYGFDLLTVQGDSPALVRGWNANTGSIEWEWSLMPLRTGQPVESAFWLYSNTVLRHVMPVWGSHLEVTEYFANSGQALGTTSKTIAPWINAENCVLSGIYYVCIEGSQLISLDLTSTEPQVLKKTLQTIPKMSIKPLEGLNGVLLIDRKLVSIKDDIQTCSNLESNSFIIGSYNQRQVIAQADLLENRLHLKVHYLESCKPADELSQVVTIPEHFGPPTLKAFDCKLKRNNDGKSCLFLLATEDESILAVQQEKIRWYREEALANVIGAEFIDLPLADAEGTLEKEMKGKAADIGTAFLQRISTQILLIKSIFLHVIGLGAPPSDTQKAGLVRDSFGLHKMLVALTKSGKIFGLDNISGKRHWQYYLPNVESFGPEEEMRLIVQRTSKHFPLQPLCAIVAKDKTSGNGVLFNFNPITGKQLGLQFLNYKIKQMLLLPETENNFIKGILTITEDNQLNVYPPNAKDKANGFYYFTADKKTALLEGFIIKLKNDQLFSLPVWNANLGGLHGEQKILTIATKNPNEHVHSQGRVLGDRSVLYKYVNPNLVAVFTHGLDLTHKFLLNLHLIDVVSGTIIFSLTHQKIRAPLHVVHSENWLAYTYFNDKTRRTEITTVELYEGKTQTNSTVFSSLNAPQMPLIERQSYIIPTFVEAMRETITERGITNKHVLIGTSSGAIVELPWALLDPRRPIASTTQGREEGAIPYIPELPLPTENIINYNQTIARLKNIFTAPSGLESTCLVFATGLDMFVTRVAPSKTFDLLKEDFDYILITIVLIALTTGSLVTKHLASRKQIKQAWK